MASRYADIPALNHIISLLLDETRRYRRALSLTQGGASTEQLQKALDERCALLADMQARVRALGGRPMVETSMGVATHKAMVHVRALFDHDVNGAMAEVERDEQRMREAIREAMRRDDVSAETRAFLGVALDRAVTGESRAAAKPEAELH